jgi:high-affinity iron transporter
MHKKHDRADQTDNTASIGTILSYVFYWLLIVATLLYLKWSEGRLTLFGKGSKAHQRMTERTAGKQPVSEPTSSEQGHSPVLSPSEEKVPDVKP